MSNEDRKKNKSENKVGSFMNSVENKDSEGTRNSKVNSRGSNCDEKENLEKNYEYAEGYIKNNADRMTEEDLENLKEKQEHRKDQMDQL